MQLRKTRYQINPKTLAMGSGEMGFKYWLRRSGWYLIGGFCIGIVFFLVFFYFFPSPRESQLQQQNRNLEAQLQVLNSQVDQMQIVMKDFEQRDENLYRVLFGAEPIPLSVRTGANRRIAYYDSIARMTNSQLASDLTMKIDLLAKETYIQAKSYDELLELAKTQEVRMKNLPAIQPVLNKDLKRTASGYGMRIDPVYHVRRFHAGMDFSAPVGTDVFATGNAKVVFTGWKQGYGNTVELDHGFGYTTLCAQLYKVLVQNGQNVKGGDVIALVGNTGKSTGPHLHYEVRYQDKPVDPRNFYFYDLTPEQYDQMIQLSNNFGHMLD